MVKLAKSVFKPLEVHESQAVLRLLPPAPPRVARLRSRGALCPCAQAGEPLLGPPPRSPATGVCDFSLLASLGANRDPCLFFSAANLPGFLQQPPGGCSRLPFTLPAAVSRPGPTPSWLKLPATQDPRDLRPAGRAPPSSAPRPAHTPASPCPPACRHAPPLAR